MMLKFTGTFVVGSTFINVRNTIQNSVMVKTIARH